MLAPRSRRLLLDGLRPPAGYRFDRAVGTSFTLDLLALMTAPLAFTFFDWETGEGRTSVDPLALFEALRRHADRISLFCQAGRIAVPKSGPLLQFLEGSVFAAAAPREGGLFHPKVWLLRYTADDEPVHYRMLCLSRNLTFDRSWDTALVLDGTLQDRMKAFAANHRLGDFVASLPGLAVRPIPDETREAIVAMSDEVRKVRFDLPEGFEEAQFWPLGLPGKKLWPFPEPTAGRRMLTVSPFLGSGLLNRVAKDRLPGVLISRPESLAEIAPATLERFEKVFVLHPSADPEDEDAEAAQSSPDGAAAAERAEETWFTGLHAKLYVMDDGWNARVWTGSANATEAAFESNVEFLVELVGKKTVCGIDALLGVGEESQASLGSLLIRYTGEVREIDEDEKSLELALDAVCSALGRMLLTARAVPVEGDLYTLTLSAQQAWPEVPQGLRLVCRPVTIPSGAAAPVETGAADLACFGPLTVDALTQFFAIDATLRRGTREKTARFVVNVPLEGGPADRRERLLRSLLGDAKQVLRLIWLLLSEADIGVQEWVEAGTGSGGGSWRPSSVGGFPILETMLKALERGPSKLDEVARLVDDLRRSPEGAELLPSGFDSIWEPIWKTREELR